MFFFCIQLNKRLPKCCKPNHQQVIYPKYANDNLALMLRLEINTAIKIKTCKNKKQKKTVCVTLDVSLEKNYNTIFILFDTLSEHCSSYAGTAYYSCPSGTGWD